MLSRGPAWSPILLPALLAALSTMPAGCGTEPARGTGGGVVATDPSVSMGDEPANGYSAAPRPKLLPGAKTVALSRVGNRPDDKTFDDIRFEIEPGARFRRQMLPKSVESLAGQRIRIRGYILPTAQKRGIKQFVLVRDNQECCFGPGAAIYDCILVEMQPGKTAEFSIRPVAVEGTFDIDEILGPDDKHLAIYRIDGDSVR